MSQEPPPGQGHLDRLAAGHDLVAVLVDDQLTRAEAPARPTRRLGTATTKDGVHPEDQLPGG